MTTPARLATPLAGACLAIALGAGLAIPAAAQSQGPFGGFKHDNTQPIEITSDSLEVRQDEQLAIFSGQVVAGQGTLRLTAERVEVYYDEDQDDAETGAIRRMRAEGDVLLSNGSETARGAWGEYDVEAGTMTMGGDVVLTQGQNAINGESLVIDLEAGTGRVEGRTGGRVKSVFNPSRGQGG
ncbi:MAG: lipopolysaccharide transport periplasmic protein LptA [Paracoccaceae bacterium]